MDDKLEKFILQHREEFDDLVPGKDLFTKIQAGINQKPKSPLIMILGSYWKMGIAASLLVTTGFGLFWLSNNSEAEQNTPIVMQIKDSELEINENYLSEPRIVKEPIQKISEEIPDAVHQTVKFIAYPKISSSDINLNKLRNSGSASERYKIASEALDTKHLDKEIVNALFFTMQNDENTNVRLAAFESLSLFAHEKNIKNQFIKSLTTQKDPVIKVAIIELLTNLRTERIRDYLEEIAGNKDADPMIIEKAHQGLIRLNY